MITVTTKLNGEFIVLMLQAFGMPISYPKDSICQRCVGAYIAMSWFGDSVGFTRSVAQRPCGSLSGP